MAKFLYKLVCELVPLIFATTLLKSVCVCESLEVMGIFNKTYTHNINKKEEIIFTYNFDSISDSDIKIKIDSKLHSDLHQVAVHEYPIFFTVRQQLAASSWQLPVTWLNDTGLPVESYDTMERTLCFNPIATTTNPDKEIQVVVYTRSVLSIKFSITVTDHRDFMISDGNNYTSIVSPVMSQFYYYNFTKPTQDFALIKISSMDSVCMTVSIQPPTCPVFSTDSELPTRGGGFWETVSKSAGITVRRSDFPNGFFLVLVVQKDDSRCLQYQGIVPNNDNGLLLRRENSIPLRSSLSLSQKSVHFQVRSREEVASYWKPVLFPLLFYFGLTITIFLVFIWFHHQKYKIALAALNSSPTSSSQLLEDRSDVVSKRERNGSVKKWQSPVRIHDLVKMDITRLEKKSERYCWSIIVVAVFYCLPVIQLTWIYVRVMLRTGDQDLCYYNFRCAQPWGYLPVFNHLYSNAGYIILGIVFIILVHIKQRHLIRINNDTESIVGQCEKCNGVNGVYLDSTDANDGDKSQSKCNKRVGFGSVTNIQAEPAEKDSIISKVKWSERIIPKIQNSRDNGIFYHFGLFYAMGLALIMEGVMSAAYHVCPTQLNFQFDTAFMYIIVMLCIVKLYQFRHPVYMNANIIFICLAVVAILVFFGLWSNGNPTIRLIFVIFHFIVVFNCLIFQYYVGYLRISKEVITSLPEVYKYFFSKLRHMVTKGDLKTFNRQTVVLTRQGEFRSYDFSVTRHRAILPVLVILFNLLVTVVNFTVLKDDNFATQVLGILIVNLVAYLIYYCIMKYLHDEYKKKMWMQSLFYAVLSIALWAPSMRYFTMNLTSWDRSPAESRIQNQECFIMNFYDFHDFWHFLSAGAMFASFMVLLTIDDDLIGCHKSEIPVF